MDLKWFTPLLALAWAAGCRPGSGDSYGSLSPGQNLAGFEARSVYLDETERSIGARFLHLDSGFTLDLIGIESVPQTMVCVTTFPTSDMGEPHAQEHLLLGKGNKGRAVANMEPMALAGSTAFTMQWRTCYSFNTAADMEVFYGEFERRMDALLHPDYSDEEIRREVRNFGVTASEDGERLDLEEKGTVYNEMVSSMAQSSRRIRRVAMQAVYGEEHPLALNSGGQPEALRLMAPSDIRAFHSAHYHLGNMSAVVSLPPEADLRDVLTRMDAMFRRLGSGGGAPVLTEADLPPPRPAPEGGIRRVDYPHQNPAQPGSVWLVWPADRSLDLQERTLLALFLETLAGDPATNLYRRFVDRQTRLVDLGAQSVFGTLVEEQGQPVIIGFGDVPVDRMSESALEGLRADVMDELERVAGYERGSAELADFGRRLGGRVVEWRREMSKFVNSPPEFGIRGTGADWVTHLDRLNREPGFRKSVTMSDILQAIEAVIGGDENPWTGRLRDWHLIGARPWVLAARPDPGLIRSDREERDGRIAAEVERLRIAYSVDDPQEAIRRYARDYDVETRRIEAEAEKVVPPRFLDEPPMSLDDRLTYATIEIDPGVPLVASTFESMTGATAGIALHVAGLEPDEWVYLSILPRLLVRAGVIENGVPVSYAEMTDRLRREVLGLDASFRASAATGRVELRIRGAGNDPSEAGRAVDWMQLILEHPDWREENLQRLRDVVDQTLSDLGRTTQRAEETWVRGVADAYRHQANPEFLSAVSFMTEAYHVRRVRWRLKEGSAADRALAADRLEGLAGAVASASDASARLGELASAGGLLSEAARDLEAALLEVPDSSLRLDWDRLCREMAADLRMDPRTALEGLDRLRRKLLGTGRARLFLVSSSRTRERLIPAIAGLVGGLAVTPAVETPARAGPGRVIDRLRQRHPGAEPVFVGLVNPNTQGGVFLHSAPLTGYGDLDTESLLDFLAANLYGGGGGHSIFMKTIGAGLAYSNGIGSRPAEGRVTYYAERTPDLPQTLRFVISELERTEPDPQLVEYAIAQAFGGSRAAAPYEQRGEAMASDLAEGRTPSAVESFRRAILDLRSRPSLAEDLHRRIRQVYGRVLPGWGPASREVEGAVYLVIGPESQLESWERYLRLAEGPDATLYRLYPRDFWI